MGIFTSKTVFTHYRKLPFFIREEFRDKARGQEARLCYPQGVCMWREERKEGRNRVTDRVVQGTLSAVLPVTSHLFSSLILGCLT